MNNDQPSDPGQKRGPGIFSSSYVAVGIAIGVAIGIALDNIAIGIAVGLVVGAGRSLVKRRQDNSDA